MATQHIDITIEALNNPPEIHLERLGSFDGNDCRRCW